MSDLRQGVTPTQHEVLDRIEIDAACWENSYDIQGQLEQAAKIARSACHSTYLSRKRTAAIEAAARLIDAADQITRLIAVNGDGK